VAQQVFGARLARIGLLNDRPLGLSRQRVGRPTVREGSDVSASMGVRVGLTFESVGC
jgi:hypothetical protein